MPCRAHERVQLIQLETLDIAALDLWPRNISGLNHVNFGTKFRDDTTDLSIMQATWNTSTYGSIQRKNIDEAVDQRRKQLSVCEKVKDIFLDIC